MKTVTTGCFDLTNGETPTLKKVKSYSTYKEHIRETVLCFNRMFKKYNLPLAMNASKLLPGVDRDPETYCDKNVQYFLMGDNTGRVWPNQIETTVKIIKETYLQARKKDASTRKNNGVCVAPTCSGKTGTSNACYLLAPTLCLLTDKNYKIITILPNKGSVEAQAKPEFIKFVSLYGNLEVTHKGNSIKLKSYLQNPDFLEFEDNDDQENIHRRHAGPKFKEKIKNMMKQYPDVRKIFLVDEPHFGSGKESVLSVFRNLVGFVEDKNNFMIGFSATPFDLACLENVWLVRSKLCENMCGFNMFMGSPIDEDVNMTPPEYMSMEQFAKKSKVDDFANIVNSLYMGQDAENKFYKAQVNRREEMPWLPDDYETYKDRCDKAIAEAIKWCLLGKNPKKARGLVMRLENHNIKMTDYANNLQAMLGKEIKVLLVFGEGMTRRSVAATVQQHNKEDGRKFVIIVTGMGRMADQFPESLKIGYFMEFAGDSNMIAILQGLGGRTGGHGKGDNPPMLVLSAKSFAKLKAFEDSMGKLSQNPNNRTLADGARVGSPTKSVLIDKEAVARDSGGVLQKVWDWFSRQADKLVSLEVINGKTKKLEKIPSHPNDWPFTFAQCLTEEVFDYLEKHSQELFRVTTDVEFIRPDKHDDEEHYYWTKKHITPGPGSTGIMSKIGWRSAWTEEGPDGEIIIKSKSHRTLVTRPDGKFHDIQCHVLRTGSGKNEKWELVSVRLRLCRAVQEIKNADRTLPKTNNVYAELLVQEELNAVGGLNANR